MNRVFIALGIAFLLSVAANASEKNCVLTEQTWFSSGKKKVRVLGVFAPTYDACKYEAVSRKLNNEDKEDVEKSTLTYTFRQPAVEDVILFAEGDE